MKTHLSPKAITRFACAFVGLVILLASTPALKSLKPDSPEARTGAPHPRRLSSIMASITTQGGSDPSPSFHETWRADSRTSPVVSGDTGAALGEHFLPSPETHPQRNATDRYAADALRHSISGHVADINNRPISNVRISMNGVYLVVTDATGRYTATTPVTRTYTLTPHKDFYIFSPASRTVSVPLDATGQDFTVEPDLGFRPDRDGYSFKNPGWAEPDCQDLHRSFSGLDIKCSGGQPEPQYSALFDQFKFSFRSGICTGMAATSLAYYVGLGSPPQATTTFELTFEQAWANIAALHGRQYSRAVLDQRIRKLSAWNTVDADVISQQVDQVYRQLRLAVQPSNPDPVVLDLVSRPGCPASGHTVVPYRLDETDPLHPKVYVYENFAAGDSTKFITFDFSSPRHLFSYWKWDSTSCSALVAIPISAFMGPQDKVPSRYLGLPAWQY